MRKYITVFRKTLALQFTYNSNVFFSILSSLIFVLLQYSLWQQIIEHGSSDSQLTIGMMSTYIILGMIIRNLTTADISDFLAEEINKGSIDLYLVKPYSLFFFSFARHLAVITGLFITRGLIIVLVCLPFIGSQLNIDLSFSFYFLLSVGNAIIMSFCLDYIIGLMAFVFVKIWPIKYLVRDIGNIFSGFYVPLWFFPQWLITISNFTPFKYMYFFPLNIIIGNYSKQEVVQELGISAAWSVLLLLIITVVWRISRKNIISQGG
ncbi:ABC-2 family transporter protein [Paenibacillus sp. KS-LC4]|uniref:ABC transporter permease n=1 Tax=Paenibacillus sp. KS-LC4 TaxID=2979727 RepID=UPI0030CC53F5